jgi:hypothetical protein
MDQVATGTALTTPWPTDLKTVFGKQDGADAIVARVRSEALEQAKGLTVATKKDREALASIAYQVAKRKMALDEAGKALNDDLRVSINAVDAERRKIRESLDALRDEVRAPLTKWETAEAERVAALKARLDRLARAQDALPENPTADQITAMIARVDATAIDDTWGEFTVEAARAKDAALATLRKWQAVALQREAEAAELARLRAEAEARADADRLRIEADRAEAERQAAIKAEAERQARIEQDAHERAARAAAEVEARAKAEAERVAKEAANREAAQIKAAQEAEARHAREMEEAAERESAAKRQAAVDLAAAEQRQAQALADAKAQADRAAQAERDRIAAQATAEAVARAKREADAAHRAKIKGDIVTALQSMAGRATPDAIADAIMAGQIPHVQVMM